MKADVLIIGAGIAGAVAAYKALELGYKVIILEEGKCPQKRREAARGWLGSSFNALTQLNVDDPMLINKASKEQALLLLNDLIKKKYNDYIELNPLSGEAFANALYESIKNKATIEFSINIEKITSGKTGFFAHTNKGKFSGKRLVLAIGRNSYSQVQDMKAQLKINTIEPKAELGLRVETPTEFISAINEKCFIDPMLYSTVTEWENYNIISALPIQDKKDISTFFVGLDANPNNVAKTAKIINILSNDKIRKEKMADFIRNQTITKDFPIYNSFADLFQYMEEICPSFILKSNIYIPEIKIYGSIKATNYGETNIPNLFAIGHCSSRVSNTFGSIASAIALLGGKSWKN